MRQTREQPIRSLGIDIGSTTVKLALMEGGDVLYERYERHYSQARQKILDLSLIHIFSGSTAGVGGSGSLVRRV